MAIWNDVDWVNGEIATETKLDQVQQNIVYVREQLEGRAVATPEQMDEYESYGTNDPPTGIPKCRVELRSGASVLASKDYTAGEFTEIEDKLVDVDISGLTVDALHTITIEVFCAIDSDPWPAAGGRVDFRIFRRADLARLSWFFSIKLYNYAYPYGGGYHAWRALVSKQVVLGHRINQSW